MFVTCLGWVLGGKILTWAFSVYTGLCWVQIWVESWVVKFCHAGTVFTWQQEVATYIVRYFFHETIEKLEVLLDTGGSELIWSWTLKTQSCFDCFTFFPFIFSFLAFFAYIVQFYYWLGVVCLYLIKCLHTYLLCIMSEGMGKYVWYYAGMQCGSFPCSGNNGISTTEIKYFTDTRKEVYVGEGEVHTFTGCKKNATREEMKYYLDFLP